MQVSVNGNQEDVAAGITIMDFLTGKCLDPEKVVVERNLKIVQKEDYAEVVLAENDAIEILRFVGGG